MSFQPANSELELIKLKRPLTDCALSSPVTSILVFLLLSKRTPVHQKTGHQVNYHYPFASSCNSPLQDCSPRRAGPPEEQCQLLITSTLCITAWGLILQHGLFMLCFWDGRGPCEQHSHSSQRLVSFQGRRAAPHGGARKAQDGAAAQRSCSGFKGDQVGKICWCCIQHRRRGWLLPTLRASALKPNFPWPSLFHSVDLHPLATCKNREMSVSAQLQIQIKKEGAHKEHCNSLLHGAFYCVS